MVMRRFGAAGAFMAISRDTTLCEAGSMSPAAPSGQPARPRRRWDAEFLIA
jgi:hypothetical protein